MTQILKYLYHLRVGKVQIIDAICAPLTLLPAIWMRLIRQLHISKLPLTRTTLLRVGTYPVTTHYYDPLLHPDAKVLFDEPRHLPGVDLNLVEQLAFIASFDFSDELRQLPRQASPKAFDRFYYDNPVYPPGDSEMYYSIIRHKKPKRIIEIGSGYSTLIALEARTKNQSFDPHYKCNITCIEPYAHPWLETKELDIKREKVEDLPLEYFQDLNAGDILFIDSTHIIKPGGDVLREYLQILPSLKKGVLIHVHDIFTPREYPRKWIKESVVFWNEQYMLEAFLSCNVEFKVFAATNHLKHTAPSEMAKICPILGERINEYEPGSFWMVKV